LKMKFLIFSFLLFFTMGSFAQKQRLVGDDSRFLCVADSINYFSIKSLTDRRIQLIFSILYDYDNGRVSEAKHYILWKDNETGRMKTITGCDNPSTSDSSFILEPGNLFNYFDSCKIDTISRELTMISMMSHDMGYFVTVYLSGQEKSFRIRDCDLDIYNEQYRNGFGNDPRVTWINMFEKLIGKSSRH